MSVELDPNWKKNTTDDPRSVPSDKQSVDLLSGDTMKAATIAAANYILTNIIDADQFLQEFVNRALTDIGYDLTITKGLHQAADSSPYLPTRHFDTKATGKKPANPGTHGLIYHLYVTTGTTVKKKGTIILEKIAYKESGTITSKSLGGLAVGVV